MSGENTNKLPGIAQYDQKPVDFRVSDTARDEVSRPIQGIYSQDSLTLATIIDAIPFAVQILDQKGIFLDCNRKTFELCGVDSVPEIIGESIGNFIPEMQPEGKKIPQPVLKQVSEAFSGGTHTCTGMIRRKTGETVPVRVTMEPLQYEGEACLLVTETDTTGEVAAKHDMKTFLEEIPLSVLTVSPDIEIVAFNPAYLTITELTREEAETTSFADYKIYSREGGSIQDAKTLKKTIRGRFVCDYGKCIKNLEYTYIPILDTMGEVVKIYHVMQDLTEVLNRIHEFDSLVTESPIGILTMDPSTRILSANNAFLEISGLSAAEVTSRHISDFTIISRSGPAVSEVLASKKPGRGVLTGTFGRNVRTLEYSYIPIIDITGEVVRILTLYADNTAISRNIEYLQQSVARISEYIEHLAAGNTAFTAGVIPPDEFTSAAYESFLSITAALNHAKEAFERVVANSQTLTTAAVDGRLSFRTDPAAHQGNFRTIIEGMNQTLEYTLAPGKEAMRVSGEYARYNFTARFSPSIGIKGDWTLFQKSLDDTGIEISEVITTLTGKVVELSASIEKVCANVSEISSGADSVSETMNAVRDNSRQGNESIGQILRAMDDLTTTVAAVAQKAESVASLTQDANEVAQAGMELARKTVDSMSDITRSTGEVDCIVQDINTRMNEIGKIVRLISDIASQTNLLALNAAIEAARAGEAGRGFAVVASEVKSLALDSRSSAENISELISDLQKMTKSADGAMKSSLMTIREGNAALEDTMSAFEQIASKIEIISRNIIDVASSAEEQAASVEEITASMQEVSLLTHTNTEGVEETSCTLDQTTKALNRINKEITLLVGIADGVNGEVEQFRV